MADWPTLDEVKAELRFPLAANPVEDPVIDTARLAAIDYVNDQTGGQFPPDVVPVEVPNRLYEAALLQACHYYRRRDSLDGTIGWGDMGVVRVGGRGDPDVEQLIDRYRTYCS